MGTSAAIVAEEKVTAQSKQPPRVLSVIAADILAAMNQPYLHTALPFVVAMEKLRHIDTAADYVVVAAARRAIGPWRSSAATRIKHELATIFTLYRADDS